MHTQAASLKKLDAGLWEAYKTGALKAHEALPVIVRCEAQALDVVTSAIAAWQGRVRHKLVRLGRVVAWVPGDRILALAGIDGVRLLSLEEQSAVAR